MNKITYDPKHDLTENKLQLNIGKAYEKPMFDGETFDKQLDQVRLKTQLAKVKEYMLDGQWRTLSEIQRAAGGSESGVAARLRDLRKERFGAYDIQRKRISNGTWQYRLQEKK